MSDSIFLATVGASASISVATTYFGVLANYSRLRSRRQRVFGLSLLAEVKSLQRRFRHYRRSIEDLPIESQQSLPKLTFTGVEAGVFNNGSGNLGLFETRTALEVVEFYSTLRDLAAQAEALSKSARCGAAVCAPRGLVAEHLQALRLARHRSRIVVKLLRRDIPLTPGEAMSRMWRRLAVVRRRIRERGGVAWGGPIVLSVAVLLAGAGFARAGYECWTAGVSLASADAAHVIGAGTPGNVLPRRDRIRPAQDHDEVW